MDDCPEHDQCNLSSSLINAKISQILYKTESAYKLILKNVSIYVLLIYFLIRQGNSFQIDQIVIFKFTLGFKMFFT